MDYRGQSGQAGGCGILLVAIFLVLLVVTASAQKNQNSAHASPKYDVSTETKMKGTVDELRLPPKGSEKEIAHLMVKNGDEIVDVYLCPASFFNDMGMGFNKGEELVITGSKVKVGGADLILAREVVKGNDTFVLRDEKGSPVWR